MGNKIGIVSVITLTLTISQVSFSKSSPMINTTPALDDHPCALMPLIHTTKDLALTPQQELGLKTIRMAKKITLLRIQKELKVVDEQINALIIQSTLDEESLDSLITKKAELLGLLFKDKAIIKHQSYNVLSPEQKIKFDALIERMKKLHTQCPQPNIE